MRCEKTTKCFRFESYKKTEVGGKDANVTAGETKAKNKRISALHTNVSHDIYILCKI
jgi:hypothetical protein